MEHSPQITIAPCPGRKFPSLLSVALLPGSLPGPQQLKPGFQECVTSIPGQDMACISCPSPLQGITSLPGGKLFLPKGRILLPEDTVWGRLEKLRMVLSHCDITFCVSWVGSVSPRSAGFLFHRGPTGIRHAFPMQVLTYRT